MKKIDKEALLSIYNKLNVFVGLGIFLVLVIYFNNFPETMYGAIDKGIFSLDLSVAYGTQVEVFNFPLVWFILFFLLNLGFLIFTQTGEKVESGAISESIFYNTILSFLLIVAQLVFYYIIPETVNGDIVIGLFQYDFDVLSDVVVSGYNFAYILATVYTFYNMFVLFLALRNAGTE